MSFQSMLDKVGTQAVKDAIEAAYEEAIRDARREVTSLRGIVTILAIVISILVVWILILTGIVISHNIGDNILDQATNLMIDHEEDTEDEEVPVVTVDASTPLVNDILDNFAETFYFEYQVVENGAVKGYGRVSCPEEGPVHYFDYYDAAFRSALNDGVWISVEGCGANGYDLKDQGDIARIYLPIEEFERVSTALDLFEVLRREGTLYWINQNPLATLLNVNVESLPVNMDLPTAP